MFGRMTLLLILVPGIVLTSACSNNNGDSNGDNNNNNNNNNNGTAEVTITNPLQDSSLIDSTVQALLDNNPVPGMAVSIISNPVNPVIWSKGYGVTNIETAAPVSEHTSFWMGSVSKAVMGTAIMVAQEKG